LGFVLELEGELETCDTTVMTLGFKRTRGRIQKTLEILISNHLKVKDRSKSRIINYNSKREDLEEEDQRQDERNVIL